MVEKMEEKQKDMCTMRRGKTGGSREVKNCLMSVATDATRNHVWVHYPAAAGVCYYQRPGKHPWSRLPYSDMLLSVGCAEKRADPGDERTGELTPPQPATVVRRAGLGSTVELAQLQESWPQGYIHGKAGPATRLVWWQGQGRDLLPSILPSPLRAGRRAAPAPPCYSIWESRPCA